MSGLGKKKWVLEVIWWIITLVVVILVTLPILSNGIDFVLLPMNILMIVVFINFSRMVFFWQLNPFSRIRALRYVLFILCIPLIIYSIGALNDFQILLDDYGVYNLVESAPKDKRIPLAKFIRNEFFFFGVGAVISSFALALRLVISSWRQKNRKTV